MATDQKPTSTDLPEEVIDSVDESERAALAAVRRFVESVDQALPGGGAKGAPSRRVEVIDAALKMVEQLLGVSNDFAQRVAESVQSALSDLPKVGPAKKAPAKKAPAKKAPAKKAPAKKAPAKKAPAKRAPAKKAPAKRVAKKA